MANRSDLELSELEFVEKYKALFLAHDGLWDEDIEIYIKARYKWMHSSKPEDWAAAVELWRKTRLNTQPSLQQA